MKKAAIISAVISAFCVLLFRFFDAKKIAKELAEALTDALVVENGKEVAEPPPKEAPVRMRRKLPKFREANCAKAPRSLLKSFQVLQIIT
jgi:hypothetical protein